MTIDADVKTLFAELVALRRATRAFLPTAVSETTLRDIFSLAQAAPSNCNTQPWLVHVVSGARCEALRATLRDAAQSGEFDMDVPYAGVYAGCYRERQFDAAARLYGAMGIERGDKAGRLRAFFKNYEFFDAPHVAFLCLPAFGGVREAADLGIYAQTLMLAMTAYGIASCPQTALGMYARTIKTALDIPADQQLLFGISFGYADTHAPANQARVPRAPLTETTRFIA